jgi:hypothetical protein
MISAFPAFSKLGIEHKDDIAEFTSRFEPYSDFNFTSLLSWDDGSTEVSMIHGNLVIKISDYVTGETAYSLLGNNEVEPSLRLLLSSAGELRFVPETTVSSVIGKDSFLIGEDRDNFDYVYLLNDLAELPGGAFKKKRNKASRFKKSFAGQSIGAISERLHPGRKPDIDRIFSSWHTSSDKDEEEILAERNALLRLVEYSEKLDILFTGVAADGICVGFSLNEKIGTDFAICHFEKALAEYNDLNIYTYLSQQAAKDLSGLGCKYVNWEQDLGLPGLRKAKLSYKPAGFLKKYTVKPR